MLIDITDNFESLNRFILIGDTKYLAIIEKIFGYPLEFIFIAIGILSWISSVIELQNKRKEELKKLRTIGVLFLFAILLPVMGLLVSRG